MPRTPFDKYQAYFDSVQDPEGDLKFVGRRFRDHFGRLPTLIGEDFCGTFAFCCTWVKKSPGNKAIGVDYAAEPLIYGMKHYHPKLSPEQRTSVTIARADVRDSKLPKAEVIVALNYSYFIFKRREDLRDYFRNAFRRLSPRGLFVLDAFGGSDCLKGNLEATPRPKGITYYWEQHGFDHGTNEAQFSIHFKRRGEKRRSHVFRYDWRMWSIPELREILTEAGFSKVEVYWESDGPYRQRKADETDTTWLAYIVAVRR